MNIILQKATSDDCREIHSIQIAAFKSLFGKYNDEKTNPATETIERVLEKLNQDYTDYYIVKFGDKTVGFIRVIRINEYTCRISPMGILPQYQGFGYAQMTIAEVEKLYPSAKRWELDTIKQEAKLCYLYEKMGYIKTGKQHNIKEGMDIIFYAKSIRRAIK